MLYAHYDKITGEEQLLIDHLEQVARRMMSRLSTLQYSCVDNRELKELLREIGFFHDIGKAMKAFQDYLETGKGDRAKDHALISAAIFSHNHEENIPLYLAMLTIARHHGDLTRLIDSNSVGVTQLPKQYQDWFKQVQSNVLLSAYVPRQGFSVEHYQEFLSMGDAIPLKRFAEKNGREYFFFLQYCFSKLLWADKLDSAGIAEKDEAKQTSLADIELYIKRKNSTRATVDEKREQIRRKVLERIENLADETFDQQRIFLLTAPTGTGKSLTSICAAVKIAERMRKMYGIQANIITALPFINILEQTKIDYEEIFTDVLVHYSAAELVENGKDQEESQEQRTTLKNQLLVLSAWESPVVITTFVQFFESILSAKNNRLIKLHKLAGSVVILDEIQSIPSLYQPLLGAIIQHISYFYGTRFILMTATQPEIVTSANHLLDAAKMLGYELLPNYAEYYTSLKRTKLVPVLQQVTSNEELVRFIQETKTDNQSALVVVNTIAQSIEFYQALKDSYKTLYLSTNLTSADRKKVIQEAKRLLKIKTPFVMVSTQTIEAGVDLDFDIGYRDFAPLESIIQVAGRINRAGDKGEYLPLYLFNTGTDKLVYKHYFRQSTIEVLDNIQELGEDKYLELVQKYYHIVARSEQYDREFYAAMKELSYDKIQEFSLIEEQSDIKTVLIEADESVHLKAEEYSNLLKTGKLDFNQKAELKKLLRQLGQYTVDVRIRRLIKNQPCKFADVHRVKLDWYVVQQSEVENYYNETGFMAESPKAFVY